MDDPSPASERLRSWERLAILALVGAVLVFGVLVDIRSAFLSRRLGDAGVYFRAAWAARQGGAELYTITDDNLWHYHYPPLFALLLTPLADAPGGVTASWIVPFPVSIALWYVFSVACLAWALHVLAAVLDPDAVPGGRRWWLLRLLPLWACVATVGETLGRGQLNLLLLAILGNWMASSLRGRPLRAGLWLALSICLKIIPVFLVLVPLARRDRRCLAGCTLGLFVGLLVVPSVCLGARQTFACYRAIGETVLGPALGIGEDDSRAVELIHVTSGHSQSFLSILHNAIHPDPATRPTDATPTLRAVHLLLGAAMTLCTLWVFRRRAGLLLDPPHEVLFCGCMILTMLMLSPVCHMHYFSQAMPLLMALMVLSRGNGVYPKPATCLLLGFNGIITLLPYLPGLRWLQDVGTMGLSGLLLWAIGCWTAGKTAADRAAPSPVLLAA